MGEVGAAGHNPHLHAVWHCEGTGVPRSGGGAGVYKQTGDMHAQRAGVPTSSTALCTQSVLARCRLRAWLKRGAPPPPLPPLLLPRLGCAVAGVLGPAGSCSAIWFALIRLSYCYHKLAWQGAAPLILPKLVLQASCRVT